MVSRSRKFAHQDDVRVFTQRRAQRFVEAMRVAVHFALVDQALLRGVHEFDRILDGEDVAVFVLVDVVDHRRQRGRLARTGRAGHQDQALRLLDHLAEQRRAGQVLEGEHLGRNGTEHRTGATVLVERVHTEARQRRDLEGEVHFEEFLVIAALLVGHDVVHQRMDLLVVQGGMLMRRTSPSTRIIGGRPADRCRSDALFLTENASSSAISMSGYSQ
jgi:hypothetical protein